MQEAAAEPREETGPGKLPADWLKLSKPERKAFAAEAVSRRDANGLAALTWALLEHSGRPPSAATQRSYRWSIGLLTDQWSGEQILNPSDDLPEIFVAELKNEGISDATLNVHGVGLRALYRALRWAGVTTADPFRGLRIPLDRRHEGTEPYTASELESLLRKAEPRDQVLLLLAAENGLGISEVVRLTKANIALDGRVLTVSGRNDSTREVPLSPMIAATLSQLAGSEKQELVGVRSEVQARERVRRLCQQAGVDYRGYRALVNVRRRRTETPLYPAAVLASGGFGWTFESHPVTGVPGMPDLRHEMVRALAEWDRLGIHSALVCIRLTNFPSIVEEQGVEVGNALLRAAAGKLSHLRRPYDFLAHVGDADFVILLRNLPSFQIAEMLSARFSAALSAAPLMVLGRSILLEIDVRVAARPIEPDGWLAALDENARITEPDLETSA